MTAHCEGCGRDTSDLTVVHVADGPVALCERCSAAPGWQTAKDEVNAALDE